MDSLLNLLNEYELFNNIFPGIIFFYFSRLQNYIPNFDKIDIYEKLFLYYFIILTYSVTISFVNFRLFFLYILFVFYRNKQIE